MARYKKLGSPLEALILADHVMWRLGVDKEMSLILPLSAYNTISVG